MASTTATTTTTNSATTAPENSEPKPKPAHKVRKRAPKACLSCRARKVRCDVSQRGRPCMNCYLDNETCVVTGRASRFRKSQREGSTNDAEISHPPYTADECGHGRTAEDVVRSRINGEPASPRVDRMPDHQANEVPQTTQERDFAASPENAPPRPQSQREEFPSFNRPPPPPPPPNPSRERANTVPTQSFEPFSSRGMPLWVGDQRVAANADITYSFYPFLAINNLHNIMPQDVNYLESQGCLRIPTRAILDEFVQQYFSYVHPLLPLVNEGDFWEMYCHDGAGPPPHTMSLLVFQAILFSCCNFVSLKTIQELGFPNIRAARATLYRRTKLLFDLDTEASLVYLAQAALLLSYWSPNWSHATKKPNTAWLGIAIQNAKSAEAHLYSAMPTFSAVTEPAEWKKQNALKRLWWGCIIRDRILPLGMRRSVQISRAHFDLDVNSGLGYVDLADEIDRSKVYAPETKRSLIEIFLQILDLCSLLTDILTLVFPLDDIPGWGRPTGAEGAGKVKDCQFALRRWYKGATLRFPMFGGQAGPRKTKENPLNKSYQHDSVIIYTNLMYMYYHSARAALCHHEVLQSAVAFTSPNSSLRQFSNIYENRHELQDAAYGVTECLKELIQLDLARFLPISAVACTALPLVLHILDVKLSAHGDKSKGTGDNQIALKQNRLNILIEAMKTYQPQYDGVDYISETIRHIIDLAQLDQPKKTNSGTADNTKNISDWKDMLASHPSFYLRLAMTMDISISKGRLAEETDFPVGLRGMFGGAGVAGKGAIQTLFSGHAATPAASRPAPAAQPAMQFFPGVATPQSPAAAAALFAPNPMAGIKPGTVHSLSSDEESNSSPASAENFGAEGSRHTAATGAAAASLLFPQEQDDIFGGNGGSMNLDHPYAHTLPTLSADMLAATAYMLHAEGFEPAPAAYYDTSGESDDHSMYDGDGTAGSNGNEEDWIERAWSDEGREQENGGEGGKPNSKRDGAADPGGDRETARALLDALRDEAIGVGA